jgi:hypothetical protein
MIARATLSRLILPRAPGIRPQRQLSLDRQPRCAQKTYVTEVVGGAGVYEQGRDNKALCSGRVAHDVYPIQGRSFEGKGMDIYIWDNTNLAIIEPKGQASSCSMGP